MFDPSTTSTVLTVIRMAFHTPSAANRIFNMAVIVRMMETGRSPLIMYLTGTLERAIMMHRTRKVNAKARGVPAIKTVTM